MSAVATRSISTTYPSSPRCRVSMWRDPALEMLGNVGLRQLVQADDTTLSSPRCRRACAVAAFSRTASRYHLVEHMMASEDTPCMARLMVTSMLFQSLPFTRIANFPRPFHLLPYSSYCRLRSEQVATDSPILCGTKACKICRNVGCYAIYFCRFWLSC